MSDHALSISVIVPVRDEAGNILSLAREMTGIMDRTGREWECVWVDDGSSDETPEVLSGLHAANRRHRFLVLAKSSGQSAALWTGFRAARGEILATMDGDGQNDPSDLPRFLDALDSGRTDMVIGYRQVRLDSPSRRYSSRIANGFRNFILGERFRDVGCGTRVFRRECVAGFTRFSGMHRFFPSLAIISGFRVSEMPANHRPRRSGKTKYGIWNRLWAGIADCLFVLWLKKRGFPIAVPLYRSDGSRCIDNNMKKQRKD